MSKAFDSPSKNILKYSWKRLGVSDEMADYLVALDIGAHTVIRSPPAVDAFEREGYTAFHHHSKGSHCKTLAEFTAERGVGQGDVGSPTNWNAVFDILLVALSKLPQQLLTTRAWGALRPVQAIGFADDLLSVAGSLQALQDQADLVSIFAMIAGLELAHAKLRTMTLHWSGNHWYHKRPPVITVHKSGWVPIVVQLQLNGQLKLLGTVFDADNSGDTQFDLCDQRITQSLNIIRTKHASPAGKLHTIKTTVLSRALYVAQHSSWSLSQLRELDKKFDKIQRELTSNQRTYPTILLSASRDGQAGHGFDKFSSQANVRKRSIFHRNVHRSGSQSECAHSIVHRL